MRKYLNSTILRGKGHSFSSLLDLWQRMFLLCSRSSQRHLWSEKTKTCLERCLERSHLSAAHQHIWPRDSFSVRISGGCSCHAWCSSSVAGTEINAIQLTVKFDWLPQETARATGGCTSLSSPEQYPWSPLLALLSNASSSSCWILAMTCSS